MSTYVDEAINPKTGKLEQALFIDDYYGSHHYGVGFKNDGALIDLTLGNLQREDYTIYPIETIQPTPNQGE